MFHTTAVSTFNAWTILWQTVLRTAGLRKRVESRSYDSIKNTVPKCVQIFFWGFIEEKYGWRIYPSHPQDNFTPKILGRVNGYSGCPQSIALIFDAHGIQIIKVETQNKVINYTSFNWADIFVYIPGSVEDICTKPCRMICLA